MFSSVESLLITVSRKSSCLEASSSLTFLSLHSLRIATNVALRLIYNSLDFVCRFCRLNVTMRLTSHLSMLILHVKVFFY